jgi:hypothetical protein
VGPTSRHGSCLPSFTLLYTYLGYHAVLRRVENEFWLDLHSIRDAFLIISPRQQCQGVGRKCRLEVPRPCKSLQALLAPQNGRVPILQECDRSKSPGFSGSVRYTWSSLTRAWDSHLVGGLARWRRGVRFKLAPNTKHARQPFPSRSASTKTTLASQVRHRVTIHLFRCQPTSRVVKSPLLTRETFTHWRCHDRSDKVYRHSWLTALATNGPGVCSATAADNGTQVPGPLVPALHFP